MFKLSNMLKIIIVFVLLLSKAVYADELPADLALLAKEVRYCYSVPGFYDRPGMIEPPYLYGYLPGRKSDSAVFWCYKIYDHKNKYTLIFVNNNAVADKIQWENYPGGLALADEEHIELSNFVYLNNPEKQGPKGKATEYAPVKSEYDGVATYFYKHEGEWLVMMVD